MSLEQLRGCIERGHSAISLARQCELLGFSRAALYYQPVAVSDEDLALMRLMDEQYLKHPYYGSRRFSIWLCERGYEVGRDKARSLMRLMGLEAIYPKPRLSLGNKEHKKYPYLLSGLEIVRPDQVWCGDIVAVVAPAVASYFPNQYLKLNGWLKSLGVRAFFDVSFGAELTIKSYLHHIESNHPKTVIAQPCPAIVTYIVSVR